MKRRQLLKAIMPLALLPLGFLGFRPGFAATSCEPPDAATLLAWLKPFADRELAGKVSIKPPSDWWSGFRGACSNTFAETFRQRVVGDFAAGKTVWVDGWLLSETEAYTHVAVSRAVSPSDVHPAGG